MKVKILKKLRRDFSWAHYGKTVYLLNKKTGEVCYFGEITQFMRFVCRTYCFWYSEFRWVDRWIERGRKLESIRLRNKYFKKQI